VWVVTVTGAWNIRWETLYVYSDFGAAFVNGWCTGAGPMALVQPGSPPPPTPRTIVQPAR
jgi:hypothetical protein